MGAHLRITSPWRQLLVLFLVFLPQLFLLTLSLMVGNDANVVKATEKIDVNKFKMLQASSSILFFLLPAILYAIFTFHVKRFYYLGFKKAERQNMYVQLWRSTSYRYTNTGSQALHPKKTAAEIRRTAGEGRRTGGRQLGCRPRDSV